MGANKAAQPNHQIIDSKKAVLECRSKKIHIHSRDIKSSFSTDMQDIPILADFEWASE